MSKKVASKNSKAVTQPENPEGKFQTNEIRIKGKDVILTGELAAEVQDWIQHKNRCAGPVPGDVALASMVGGLVGALLRDQVKAVICLPADLLAWARDESRNQDGELSDLVRELLQFERYRTERFCTYARFARKPKGGAK